MGCFTVFIGDAGAPGASVVTPPDFLNDMDEQLAKPIQQKMALSNAAGSGALGCQQC